MSTRQSKRQRERSERKQDEDLSTEPSFEGRDPQQQLVRAGGGDDLSNPLLSCMAPPTNNAEDAEEPQKKRARLVIPASAVAAAAAAAASSHSPLRGAPKPTPVLDPPNKAMEAALRKRLLPPKQSEESKKPAIMSSSKKRIKISIPSSPKTANMSLAFDTASSGKEEESAYTKATTVAAPYSKPQSSVANAEAAHQQSSSIGTTNNNAANQNTAPMETSLAALVAEDDEKTKTSADKCGEKTNELAGSNKLQADTSTKQPTDTDAVTAGDSSSNNSNKPQDSKKAPPPPSETTSTAATIGMTTRRTRAISFINSSSQSSSNHGAGNKKKAPVSFLESKTSQGGVGGGNNKSGAPVKKVMSFVNSKRPTPARWKTHQIADDYVEFSSNMMLMQLYPKATAAATTTTTDPATGETKTTTEEATAAAFPFSFGYNTNYTNKSTGQKSFQYPVENLSALAYLKSPMRRPMICERWSPYEIAIFEGAIATYGKEFLTIAREIHTKTTKEVIDFYYIWKKTSHYTRWKESYVPNHVLQEDGDSDDEQTRSSATAAAALAAATSTTRRPGRPPNSVRFGNGGAGRR